ncbi:MAG: L,D-transpeptidase family protein [Phototrophicaceae bacterium]
MHEYTPKRENQARRRHMARKRRTEDAPRDPLARLPILPPAAADGFPMLEEFGWYLRRYRGWVGRILTAVIVVAIGGLFFGYAVSGRIYPNVTAFGTNLGGLSVSEAQDALTAAWDAVEVRVIVAGQTVDTVRPAALGLQLDTAATAANAKAVSFFEGVFGTDIPATITLPDNGYLMLQDYLLDLTAQVNTPPLNAGFVWENDLLVTVPGQAGRLLDIAPTLAAVRNDPTNIVQRGEFVVQVSPVQPEVNDSSRYLDAARAFSAQPFEMIGYDPFTDTSTLWTTDRDTLTTWMDVESTGIGLNEAAFAPFIEAQVNTLNAGLETPTRYLNVEETMTLMREAIARQEPRVQLRVRYHPQDYVVQGGDTASKIARRTGIPFYLIQQHNPGRDLNVLSIGDTLNMPSRDMALPHNPVAGKRIVVDLDSQYMWAFENGQLVFEWSISSGRSSAPTSPGVYQILDHQETAMGSSYTLCDDLGCGQWEMYWFMGIYEVVPGLVNGFHGAVLLPNGGYLNGGATGYPSTFGCVMAQDENARALYEWADQGTVVEVISDEFAPLSQLAAQTRT